MKNYKIVNTETQESQIVTAYTEQQAAEKSGWFIGWCQVWELPLFNEVER